MRFNQINFFRCILLLPLLVGVGACGGSSSDSGGESSVIVYLGLQRISTAQSRIVSGPRTIALRIERNGDQITVLDQDFTAAATLAGSEFSATSPELEVIVNGGPCLYQVTYNGSVTQSSVSGVLNGPFVCGLTGALSGTFEGVTGSSSGSATLPSVAALLRGD